MTLWKWSFYMGINERNAQWLRIFENDRTFASNERCIAMGVGKKVIVFFSTGTRTWYFMQVSICDQYMKLWIVAAA